MAVEAHTMPASALLWPLSRLARQRRSWNPSLLAGVAWRGITNVGAHRGVIKLLKTPLLAEIARESPRFGFKYLTHDYLMRGIGAADRARCFLHHYRRLCSALPESLLRRMLTSSLTLHRFCMDEMRFSLSLCLSRDFDKEGELSLNLHVEGEIVFLLAFTLAPGAVIGSDADEALLISRLQGMKGSYAQIQSATRALHDVAPNALLLAALRGIAAALGISQIAAVTAARQSSFTPELAGDFTQAYDDFFGGLGVCANADGFFLMPVPFEGKPLSDVRKGHKLRTKKKRAFKLAIEQACAEFFRGQMREFAASSIHGDDPHCGG